MRRSGFPHLRGNPRPAPAFRGRTSKRRSDRPARTPPCREQPDLFVDSSRTTPLKKKTTAAKALCARCPVSDACTDFAIPNDYRDGIWGGLTVDERDQLARERATAIADEN
ncbi:WhiB family transcriptional regulator [Streptomyces griseoluteus]|uniref:WhiB family transcriptional regulator n=1 Tax=Streptomyces griseoluteus TaxID=29306 RepID=UPI0038069832